MALIKIRYHGSQVFFWVTWSDGTRHEYATNPDGQGLFVCGPHGDRRQFRGTCQFSASENRSTARRQFIRTMGEEYLREEYRHA